MSTELGLESSNFDLNFGLVFKCRARKMNLFLNYLGKSPKFLPMQQMK